MNPVDALTSQYKKGWKTSELWVAVAVGLAQVLGVTIDSNAALNDQLSNLTWVAISYILGRSGLKVARVNAQGKVVSTTAETQATAAMPATFGDDFAFDESFADDFAIPDTLEEHSV